MVGVDCHVPIETPKDRARRVLLKDLGAKRVAYWCGVSEATIYQWISRGTDERPVPPDHVGRIVEKAAEAGLSFDARALWPAMPQSTS